MSVSNHSGACNDTKAPPGPLIVVFDGPDRGPAAPEWHNDVSCAPIGGSTPVDTWRKQYNWEAVNGIMLIYGTDCLRRLPHMMAVPFLRIVGLLPCVFLTLGCYTAVVFGIRLRICEKKGRAEKYCQDLMKQSSAVQSAGTLLSLPAMIIALMEIFALLWVPVLIPDYCNADRTRGPAEWASIGFIGAHFAMSAIYMTRVALKLGRDSDSELEDEDLTLPAFNVTEKR